MNNKNENCWLLSDGSTWKK